MRLDLVAFRDLAQMLGVAQARIEQSAQLLPTQGEKTELMHSEGPPKGLVH